MSLVFGVWFGAACVLDGYGRTRRVTGHWDAIVVAGAKVWRGGKPSKALVRRTNAGVELWKQGHAPVLVFTGGVGLHGPAEAVVAAALAREQGVPESAIVIEDRSKTTKENARFARELLGPKRVLVVTDAYHVYRSELIYSREFPSAAVIGLPLGKLPPFAPAMREVIALSLYALARPFE